MRVDQLRALLKDCRGDAIVFVPTQSHRCSWVALELVEPETSEDGTECGPEHSVYLGGKSADGEHNDGQA